MTNANSPNCKFTGDIVSYMYNEMPAAKASAFELHILACTSCTDEFAEISSARYEVYEWKKLEFDPLPTPMFDLPVHSQSAEVGFIEKIRIAFGGWAVPSMAFAGLTVAILAGGILWDKSERDVAAVNSNAAPTSAEIEPARPLIQKPLEKPDPRNVEPDPTVSAPGRIVVQEQTPRRDLKTPRVVSSRAAEMRPISPAKQTSARNEIGTPASLRNPMRNAPTLNEFVEDEDTSLRLAQLFDDIETSD